MSLRRITYICKELDKSWSDQNQSNANFSHGMHGRGDSLQPDILDYVFPNSRVKTELETILKRRANSIEDRYEILEARDKLLRLLTKDKAGLKIGVMRGTCPDMCPEKERLFRDAKHQISVFELSAKNGFSLDHNRAVKQYARSSANQETPLAHEVRSEIVLRLTMDYLINEIMDNLENLYSVLVGEWYHFLWDRTRSIRKDIIQQELCSEQAVALIEECARFHIHCAARLIAEDPAVFDQKINTENLTKCLQTLKYMYNDLGLKNIQCVNESEFRGYIVLLNLNDSNFLADIKILPGAVRNSQSIKFALEVAKAVTNNNYVRFFELVRQASYLNACILLRYFTQIRVSAIRTIMKSYHWPRFIVGIPVAFLCELLAFENEKCCTRFFEEYGLRIVSNKVMLDRRLFRSNQDMKIVERALNVVEAKRRSSVAEVVVGKRALKRNIIHVALSSFDINGYLLDEAFDIHERLNYMKKEISSKTGNKENNVLPIGPLTITELSEETPNFVAVSTTDNTVICNKNSCSLNNIKIEPTAQVVQDQSYVDEEGQFFDSYNEWNLTDGPQICFDSVGGMVFQEQSNLRLQTSVDNLFKKSQPQIFSLKNTLSERNIFPLNTSASLNLTCQLNDLENSLKPSINDVKNKFDLGTSTHVEILNDNEFIVDDIILDYVYSKLLELSKYELAKTKQIRQISFLELENLVDTNTSSQVASIACNQLNMFKKTKTSKRVEAPPSWISDNILNSNVDYADKSFILMNPYKIAKSTQESITSSPISSKLYAMRLQSVYLKLPKRLKIVVSFPDKREAYEESAYLLNCYAKFTDEDGNCILAKKNSHTSENLSVCLRTIIGQPLLTQNAVEYSDYINCIIFVMTMANISLTQKRMHSLLKFSHINRAVPVHLIICDFNLASEVKRRALQLDNFILKSCFLNHTVNFCTVKGNFADAFIASLKYISMERGMYTELGMQNIRPFLSNVLGSFFWKKISEAWFVFSSFRQYCTDPNQIIRLYNESLKRVSSLLLFSSSDCRVESINRGAVSDFLYFNETMPINHDSLHIRNNRGVIQFLERLNLNSADFDFSSFENFKQSIKTCSKLRDLHQTSKEEKAYKILEHYPDNSVIKFKPGKEISWIEIIKTMALEILDSNWRIYYKDMPREVFYQKSFYEDYMSFDWWVNDEFLSDSDCKNSSLTCTVANYSKRRNGYYEEEGRLKVDQILKITNRGLKRKGVRNATCPLKEKKSKLKYHRHRILKEELELRNYESSSILHE